MFTTHTGNWEQEFMQQERILEDNVGLTAENPVTVDGDELSRTAGLLLDSLKGEENPKFQKSEFMQFMRQIRDKEMVIEGDQMVPASSSSTSQLATIEATKATASVSSARPILSSGPTAHVRSMSIENWPMKSVHFDPITKSVQEPEQTEDLSEDDAYWEAENRDYRDYWEKARSLPSTSATTITPQQMEWDSLQESWDSWEATSTGLKPVIAPSYRFQTSNPYVFDSRHGSGSWKASAGHDVVSRFAYL